MKDIYCAENLLSFVMGIKIIIFTLPSQKWKSKNAIKGAEMSDVGEFINDWLQHIWL